MSFGQAYLVVFLGGPLLMLLLTRRQADHVSLVLGVAVISALVAAALFSRRAPGLETLAMLWLAWVGTVSICVRVMMRRLHTQRSVALTKSIGAMATVIPWLGLAMADWMAG